MTLSLNRGAVVNRQSTVLLGSPREQPVHLLHQQHRLQTILTRCLLSRAGQN
jgi:hypothetical protein